MKHILILSILAVSVLPFQSSAQKKTTPGFLGKKIVLDFSGVVHPHITYNILSEPGYSSNLTEKKDWWDFGFRAGFGINVHPKLILGIQYVNLSQSSLGPNDIYNEVLGYYQPVYHEMLDYQSNSVAFKVEFKGSDGLLPVGFSHGISAGITFNSIVNREYSYRNYYESEILKKEFNESVEISKELSLSYTALVRQPISRNLAINYGLSYNLNISADDDFSNNDYGYYNSIEEELARNRRLSIMTIHLGLSVIL